MNINLPTIVESRAKLSGKSSGNFKLVYQKLQQTGYVGFFEEKVKKLLQDELSLALTEIGNIKDSSEKQKVLSILFEENIVIFKESLKMIFIDLGPLISRRSLAKLFEPQPKESTLRVLLDSFQPSQTRLPEKSDPRLPKNR